MDSEIHFIVLKRRSDMNKHITKIILDCYKENELDYRSLLGAIDDNYESWAHDWRLDNLTKIYKTNLKKLVSDKLDVLVEDNKTRTTYYSNYTNSFGYKIAWINPFNCHIDYCFVVEGATYAHSIKVDIKKELRDCVIEKILS